MSVHDLPIEYLILSLFQLLKIVTNLHVSLQFLLLVQCYSLLLCGLPPLPASAMLAHHNAWNCSFPLAILLPHQWGSLGGCHGVWEQLCPGLQISTSSQSLSTSISQLLVSAQSSHQNDHHPRLHWEIYGKWSECANILKYTTERAIGNEHVVSLAYANTCLYSTLFLGFSGLSVSIAWGH